MKDEDEEQIVIQKILGRKGKKVFFHYPAKEGQKKGTLIDRAVISSTPSSTGILYWDVIDLINFPNEAEPDWIRIGYYRKTKDRLIWGSQTTITEPISVWKKILVEAAKEKPWFRKLLEEVWKSLISRPKKIVHSDDKLRFCSRFFIYHVRMYVETGLWLQKSTNQPKGWDRDLNAILESHLIHERVLINFLCNPRTSDTKPTDVLAVDYFHDVTNAFKPVQDVFLQDQTRNIGGWLVHLTTKSIPNLKSDQEWPIRETTSLLNTIIKEFISAVPENRIYEDIKEECLYQLTRLSPPTMPLSRHAST